MKKEKKDYSITSINDFTYSLTIHGENALPLYQTISQMLKSSHYDNETAAIFFSAENVLTINKQIVDQRKLSYIQCIKMIDDLTKQIMYLKKLNYGFYGLDLNDILVIDNTYIFCSATHLLPLINDKLFFYYPIKQPYFSNPEILELTTLPSEINYKCCYYSLGSLIIFCLLNKYLLVGNEIKSREEIEKIIEPLNNTKLYWFLKRCFEENIDKRWLLLI